MAGNSVDETYDSDCFMSDSEEDLLDTLLQGDLDHDVDCADDPDFTFSQSSSNTLQSQGSEISAFSLLDNDPLQSEIYWQDENVEDTMQPTLSSFSPSRPCGLQLGRFTRTYDSVEFKPGPYLNVIIGPNGTGKSTIVCAICLGLGGKTGLLGRAQQASEFIKYGCNKAIIEIELLNTSGENYVIHREISKNNALNKWLVNGRPATMKSVEELVARLNIQVGNLCQFLPQEKVADFAKMTPEDLLENTEKAVGPPGMFENHLKLKEARTEARRLEQGFGNLQERLDQEKQKNARLEQDVRNYEERQSHLEKKEILEKKRKWIEYDEMRKKYEECKKQRDKILAEYKQEKVKYEPLNRKLTEAKSRISEADNAMKSTTDKLREVANKAHGNSKDIEMFTEKSMEVQEELKDKKQEEIERNNRINDLKRQLQGLQNDLANADQNEDLQPQIDRVGLEMRQTNRTMSEIQQEGESIKNDVKKFRREIAGKQDELRQIQNVENKKLDKLRQKHKPTYDAVMWLKENMNQFEGNVHLPIMCCINPKEPIGAKYIEMHISDNDKRAFVFENTKDYNHFMNIIRDQQNLKVNAVKVPPQPLSQFRSKPIGHFSKYGFNHYLIDYISAPDGVMRYLCAQYNVHSIPVGNRHTKNCIGIINQECPELKMFYTDEYQYSVKRSRYDGSVSSRSSKIRDPSWFVESVDTTKEHNLSQEIIELQTNLEKSEKNYGDLQNHSKELDSRLNQLREEKRKLMTMKDQRKRLMSQIESKKQRIQNEEAETISMKNEEEKATRKIKDINMKKCRSLTQMKMHTEKCFELSMQKVRQSLNHASILWDTEMLEEELRDRSQSLQNLERHLEAAKEKAKQTKDVTKKLWDDAKKATNTGNNEELSPELRQRFESCPSTIEEIDALIHEQQARADTLFQTDESVVRDYRQRKRNIGHLEKELDSKKEDLDNHQAEIEQAKQQWIEPLKELMNKINRSFSYFFSCMKCAGEVDLHVPEKEDDYEKYGVKIKVKFRDAEVLRELTSHHQSGGERSVATVLYMMALQELTKCPFRCVDEINQGMDPINERKIFELVVQTVCKKSNSQYFLLTPKLLPDLDYDDNMNVLCVFNGPHMLNHTQWNLKKFKKRRRNINAVTS